MNKKIFNINILSLLLLICVTIFLTGCLGTADKDKKQVEPKKTTEIKVEDTKEVATNINTTTPKADTQETTPVKNVSLSKELVVSVYYASTKEDPDGVNPENTYPSEVKISADNREDVAKKALEMLISGPKDNEKEKGFYTSIPSNTSVNYVKFKDNKVIADFSKNLNSGGGSFDMTQRRSQIENTLRSIYPNKDIEIAISVDGSEEQALQP